MNVIAIEQSAYDLLVARFETVTKKVKQIVSKSEDNPLDEWLDNQDVCQLLDLSYRSLQNYRDSGKIAYSMIDRKVYYKRSDVNKFLDSRTIKGL